jgi:rRNA-processing protein FCF1
MKILMDADCLIKLTKAGLKEIIASFCAILIPHAVKVEVVDAGKKKGCEDAFVVENNISAEKIDVFGKIRDDCKGDEALVELFDKSLHDAVGTDDVRLAKRLATNGIPFILPAVIIHKLFKLKHFEQERAIRMLAQLAPYISDDEYAMVYTMIGRIP